MDSIIGVLPGTWQQMLKENQYKISPSYTGKALFISALSMRNALYLKKENKLFGAGLSETQIESATIFILGHWRSGTTYLHNLLSLDNQYAYPRRFEVRNPHTFLYVGQKFEAMIQAQKAEKRPMDNITNSLLSPAEDEFALAAMLPYSPMLGWAFPHRQEYYETFSDFKDVVPEIIAKWQEAYQHYLLKLTFKYKKQILSKSPLNTGRIDLLLKMFPDAKFIHIHRNPYHVFQSTQKLYRTAIATSTLQKNDIEYNLTDHIIQRYLRMYNAFDKQRRHIHQGNFIDLSYEELEQNTIPVIRSIYKTLGINGFSGLEPKLIRFTEENRSYKKNTYPQLEQKKKDQIYHAAQNYFDLWGYSQ